MLRTISVALLATWLLASAPKNGLAQDPWEYTPYKITIWVAIGGNAEVSGRFKTDFLQSLQERIDAGIGAPWRANVIPAPDVFEIEVLDRMEAIKTEDLLEFSKEIGQEDKLFLVGVKGSNDGGTVKVREWDCRSRQFGRIVEQETSDVSLAMNHAFQAILKAFRPILRVDSPKDVDHMARMKMRAIGLELREHSPVIVEPGTLLLPYVRSDDKNGEPKPQFGIQTIPLTYCVAKEREEGDIVVQIHTGGRVPVSGRPSNRVLRFALAIPPSAGHTKLVLRSTESKPQPLSGYDIYAKDPETDEQELIGRTDWQGTMAVQPGKRALRLVYVRNGGQLLARIPMVTGLEPEQVVQITSDDRRLQVEGFLAGIQNWIMDVVAHQELVRVRFEKRMQEKKYDEAQKLLAEFQKIHTRDDIGRVISERQAFMKSEYVPVQKKIDKLFENTTKLLTFVKADLGFAMENDLKEARVKDPAAAAAAAANPEAAAASTDGRETAPPTRPTP